MPPPKSAEDCRKCKNLLEEEKIITKGETDKQKIRKSYIRWLIKNHPDKKPVEERDAADKKVKDVGGCQQDIIDGRCDGVTPSTPSYSRPSYSTPPYSKGPAYRSSGWLTLHETKDSVKTFRNGLKGRYMVELNIESKYVKGNDMVSYIITTTPSVASGYNLTKSVVKRVDEFGRVYLEHFSFLFEYSGLYSQGDILYYNLRMMKKPILTEEDVISAVREACKNSKGVAGVYRIYSFLIKIKPRAIRKDMNDIISELVKKGKLEKVKLSYRVVDEGKEGGKDTKKEKRKSKGEGRGITREKVINVLSKYNIKKGIRTISKDLKITPPYDDLKRVLSELIKDGFVKRISNSYILIRRPPSPKPKSPSPKPKSPSPKPKSPSPKPKSQDKKIKSKRKKWKETKIESPEVKKEKSPSPKAKSQDKKSKKYSEIKKEKKKYRSKKRKTKSKRTPKSPSPKGRPAGSFLVTEKEIIDYVRSKETPVKAVSRAAIRMHFQTERELYDSRIVTFRKDLNIKLTKMVKEGRLNKIKDSFRAV